MKNRKKQSMAVFLAVFIILACGAHVLAEEKSADVYIPDKFSWSGGSGRTSISCSEVTVSDGQAYATIVFSSPNYEYVKIGGNKYDPSYGNGTSSFTIPVQLNTNNRIIAMTNAMSAAHEITYSIYVYIAGADKNSDGAAGTENMNSEKLSEKAPELIGLEYKAEVKLAHAEYFKLYEYEDGITLLEIDTALPTEKDIEKAANADAADVKSTADADATEETAEAVDTVTLISNLYKNRVIRYLLVPEDTEIPVGMEKELIVVSLPATSVFVNSEEAADIMKQLKQNELLTVGGKEGEAPEYKDMILNQCDLALLKGIALLEQAEENADQQEMKDQLEAAKTELYNITDGLTTLSIPAILDCSDNEKTAEGKAEWLKVYGVVFGCEEAAKQLYQDAIHSVKTGECNEKKKKLEKDMDVTFPDGCGRLGK